MNIIGEKLMTSREEHGLSLEEVSEDLKISVSDLKNLEEGNQRAFTDIYMLKKYIYDYAKYLGLDYDHLVEEFNEFVFEYTSKIPVDVIERISKQKEKQESSKKALSPYTMKPKNNTKKRMILIIIAVVLVVGIITTVAVIRHKNIENNKSSIAALI